MLVAWHMKIFRSWAGLLSFVAGSSLSPLGSDETPEGVSSWPM